MGQMTSNHKYYTKLQQLQWLSALRWTDKLLELNHPNKSSWARPEPTSEMDPELEGMIMTQFLAKILHCVAIFRFAPNESLICMNFDFSHHAYWQVSPAYMWSKTNNIVVNHWVEMDRLLTQASCTVTHWVHVVFARAAPSSFFGPTTITHCGNYLQVLRIFLWSLLCFTSILLKLLYSF